jgi:hypothetical protein
MNASRSACHCLVSRTTTELDRPAAAPKNSSKAGTKSPLDMPWRTSAATPRPPLGLLQHHGGTIELWNRTRSPVAGSTRLSLARGASIPMRPAPVVIERGSACPLRTTSRRPPSSRSSACASMFASTSASNEAASMRRAPSRTIPSSIDGVSSRVDSSVTTLTSAFLPRRRSSASDLSSRSTRKVRRALERVADPHVQVIPQARQRSV